MNPRRSHELPDGHRLADGRSSAATPPRRPTRRRRRDAATRSSETEHDPRRRVLRRPGRRGRALAGPRGRARRDRARARPTGHLGGLGGLRGRRPTGSATTCATCAGSTRSSATPATAAQPLRALRPGLRAHPDPVRPRHRRRRRDATAASWSAPPTWSSRTAARSPASTATARAAASCCRGCSAPEIVGAVRAGQGDLRPGRPDEPRQGRSRPHRLDENLRLGAALVAPASRDRCTSRTPTTGTRFAQAAQPLRRASASAASTARRRHGDVPVATRSPGEEEHSTRGRARLLFEMLDGHGDGPVTDGWRSERGQGRARPVPGLQGLQDRLPGQRRHGDLQGGVPRPPLRRPAAPARRLRHGLAAAVRPGDRPARLAPAGQRADPIAPGCASWPAKAGRAGPDRELPRFAGRPAAAVVAARARAGAAHRPTAARCCCGPTRSPTTSTPRSAGPRSRCSRRPAGEVDVPTEPLCCGLTWISTGQLDTASGCCADRRRARPVRARRRAGGRARAELHGGVPLRRPRPARRRPGRPPAARPDRHPRRTAHRAHDGWEPPRARPGRTRKASRRCTATSTRCSAGTPTRAAARRPVSTAERLDSGCCGLAGNFGFDRRPRRGQPQACAEQVLLPRGARRRRRTRRARRRVLLPHPDRPARQRRPGGPAPRRAPRRAARAGSPALTADAARRTVLTWSPATGRAHRAGEPGPPRWRRPRWPPAPRPLSPPASAREPPPGWPTVSEGPPGECARDDPRDRRTGARSRRGHLGRFRHRRGFPARPGGLPLPASHA